ncbi:T9SS type A sorting domain-containing protein, partial [Kordia sp.]|uniref:T9SS type A sorting domain-containing protein n=1 Tax=Kordia sp. TaxID=1965332 RepID=UPI003D6BF970
EDISDNWITVTREEPLSVEDFENAIKFNVYPNPASNVLNLRTSSNQSFDVVIELFDISGRRVYQDNKNLSNEIQINISSYQSGVYLLSIRDVESNSRITKQIVKN